MHRYAALPVLLLAIPLTAPCQEFFGDPDKIVVERQGRVVAHLPAERIGLDYPELAARGEVNAGLDSQGVIWAVVAYNTGSAGAGITGVERLFNSRDGGKTWSSRALPMTGQRRTAAFTVLRDDRLLLITSSVHSERRLQALQVYVSADFGMAWKRVSEIGPAPYENVGEGFLSLTQLADGSVLFPVSRWIGDYIKDSRRENVVFRSTDAGRTWGERWSTFEAVSEAHLIQLKSGSLLGAFRHQRLQRPGETAAEIRAQGGALDRGYAVFKHVFIGDSEDGGRTWKDLRPVRTARGTPLLEFGEAHGQLVQLPDSRVVLVHGRRYPYERYQVLARVSHDEGKTWDPETYRLSFGAGYPASVVLEDGMIVTITGSTPFTDSAEPIGKWRAQVIRWRLPASSP